MMPDVNMNVNLIQWGAVIFIALSMHFRICDPNYFIRFVQFSAIFCGFHNFELKNNIYFPTKSEISLTLVYVSVPKQSTVNDEFRSEEKF